MVVNNPYYIKEIKKPQETVYEIKNEKEYQIPTFEEFMKTYQVDDKIVESYNSEFRSLEDMGVGKGSGPMLIGEEFKREAKLLEETSRTHNEKVRQGICIHDFCEERGKRE